MTRRDPAIYSAPLMTLAAGSQLGPYAIVSQLGQGKTGVAKILDFGLARTGFITWW